MKRVKDKKAKREDFLPGEHWWMPYGEAKAMERLKQEWTKEMGVRLFAGTSLQYEKIKTQI